MIDETFFDDVCGLWPCVWYENPWIVFSALGVMVCAIGGFGWWAYARFTNPAYRVLQRVRALENHCGASWQEQCVFYGTLIELFRWYGAHTQDRAFVSKTEQELGDDMFMKKLPYVIEPILVHAIQVRYTKATVSIDCIKNDYQLMCRIFYSLYYKSDSRQKY